MLRSRLPDQERRLYSQLRQLLLRPGLLRGSLVDSRRKCGKAGCRCQSDPRRRHRSLYLGITTRGKTRMIYVPPEWEERVREWLARYQQIRDVLERLSEGCVVRLQRRQE